jgi:hypothetical protein
MKVFSSSIYSCAYRIYMPKLARVTVVEQKDLVFDVFACGAH